MSKFPSHLLVRARPRPSRLAQSGAASPSRHHGAETASASSPPLPPPPPPLAPSPGDTVPIVACRQVTRIPMPRAIPRTLAHALRAHARRALAESGLPSPPKDGIAITRGAGGAPVVLVAADEEVAKTLAKVGPEVSTAGGIVLGACLTIASGGGRPQGRRQGASACARARRQAA
jgi:hypothetical protein